VGEEHPEVAAAIVEELREVAEAIVVAEEEDGKSTDEIAL
jgi:hypothetical protein